jgi:hypothetical protein
MVKRTIAIGDHIADLYCQSNGDPQLFHYIITRQNSAEILAWGQEYSAEAAERAALERVSALSLQSGSKSAKAG